MIVFGRSVSLMSLVIFGLVIVAVAWIGSSVADSRNKDWYYAADMNIEVAGKKVPVRIVFECRFWRSWYPLGHRSQGFRRRPESIGMIVGDGAGLIVQPENLCGSGVALSSSSLQEAKKRKFEVDGSSVKIYWLDNAESPTAIEGYVQDVAFSHESARVRVKSYRVERLQNRVRSTPPISKQDRGKFVVDDIVWTGNGERVLEKSKLPTSVVRLAEGPGKSPLIRVPFDKIDLQAVVSANELKSLPLVRSVRKNSRWDLYYGEEYPLGVIEYHIKVEGASYQSGDPLFYNGRRVPDSVVTDQGYLFDPATGVLFVGNTTRPISLSYLLR